MQQMRRFEGQVAWITGAGNGIGRATALRLADEGASIGVATLLQSEADEVVAACRDRGAKACAAVGDLGDPAVVRAAAETIRRELGPVDVLVNNVGIGVNAPFLECDDETYERVLTVNFMTAVRATRLALPEMLERGRGCVVSMASAQGEFGWPGFSAYSASKGALTAWTRQLANELGDRGVRFNCVIPGATMTAMQQARIEQEGTDLLQRSVNLHIIPRMGTPEEVAGVVAFLGSDDAAFITGSTLVADGGSLVKAHWYV